jgi:hypothetical protein
MPKPWSRPKAHALSESGGRTTPKSQAERKWALLPSSNKSGKMAITKTLATKNQPGRRTATNLPSTSSFSRGPIQHPSRQFLSPTNGYASLTDSITKAWNVSEATQLACYWLYGRT